MNLQSASLVFAIAIYALIISKAIASNASVNFAGVGNLEICGEGRAGYLAPNGVILTQA